MFNNSPNIQFIATLLIVMRNLSKLILSLRVFIIFVAYTSLRILVRYSKVVVFYASDNDISRAYACICVSFAKRPI